VTLGVFIGGRGRRRWVSVRDMMLHGPWVALRWVERSRVVSGRPGPGWMDR
jgi:hypothetical protein